MHEYNDNNAPIGSLKISQDVIATIAGNTTKEIDGVHSLVPLTANLASWFVRKQKQSPKPIHIEMNDDVATIHVNVVLKQGAKIPEVSGKLQKAVKESVQNMTGVVVAKVNVNIAGIIFDTPPQQENS